MQLNSVYLYPNKIDVYTNTLATWQTERYRRVYNRNLKVYRSVDNQIDLQVRNSDQKAADIANSVLVFNIVTRLGKDLVLRKDCTTLVASSGKVRITLTRDELFELEEGFYNYTVTQEVREELNDNEYTVTTRTPMYIDSQYGVVATLEVSGDVLGTAEDSLVVNKFSYINPATVGEATLKHYISSIINAQPQLSTTQSLHTFQVYLTNYSGTVTIEGSIDEQGASPKNWQTIQTLTLLNSTSNAYRNIVGKYTWFRIKHIPTLGTLGTVDKILYR